MRCQVSKYLVLLLLSFGAVFGWPATDAHALTSGGIGGYPANPDPSIQYSDSWFIYNLDLGQSADDAIVVSNTTEETVSIKLYPVDSIASNQGNFALESESESRDGVGVWIELSETLVTLEPGETREVPFTITIPDTADVGEHSGGIILQRANPGQVEGTGASIVTRVGVRVYQTVPGEIIRDIAIQDFSLERNTSDNPPQFRLSLVAKNKSNVTLKPTAELAITGWGKTKYFAKSNFNPKEGIVIDLTDLTDFFPGETLSRDWQLLRDQVVTTRWEWPIPAFGRYTFQVRLSYQGNNGPVVLESQPLTEWVVPVRLLLGIIGILVLLFLPLIIKKIFFGKRRWRQYKVRKGDQLVGLATQAGVSWKKLAKMNKLKQPVVKEGQVIFVPKKFVSPEVNSAAGLPTVEKTPTNTQNLKPKQPKSKKNTQPRSKS